MHGRGRCTRRASRRREPGQPVRTQEVPGEKREPATASGTCWGPPAERSEPGLPPSPTVHQDPPIQHPQAERWGEPCAALAELRRYLAAGDPVHRVHIVFSGGCSPVTGCTRDRARGPRPEGRGTRAVPPRERSSRGGFAVGAGSATRTPLGRGWRGLVCRSSACPCPCRGLGPGRGRVSGRPFGAARWSLLVVEHLLFEVAGGVAPTGQDPEVVAVSGGDVAPGVHIGVGDLDACSARWWPHRWWRARWWWVRRYATPPPGFRR